MKTTKIQKQESPVLKTTTASSVSAGVPTTAPQLKTKMVPPNKSHSPKQTFLVHVKVKFIDGHKLHLRVKPWCTIKDVKDQISSQKNIPTRNMRIFFRGSEVGNTWPLTLQEDKTALFCVIGGDFQKGLGNKTKATDSDLPRHLQQHHARASLQIRGTSSDCAPVLVEAMKEAQQGLLHNLKPILAEDGSGGTYFLRNPRKEHVVVFKPRDEEPGAINNPRGYVGKDGQIAAHRGIFAGQGCDRELAAYLLDHKNLAGVPPTALAEAVHSSFHQDRLHASAHATTTTTSSSSSSSSTTTIPVKVGILQQFVHADDVAGNLSHTMFSTEDVHRIALLDMRLLNTDRNDSNILVLKQTSLSSSSSSSFRLVPIDHGYCLPQTLNIGWCDWCWLGWKHHMDQPISTELRAYVDSLDAEKDAFRLSRETSIGPISLKNMKISLMFLKTGVRSGLTLGDIASLMVRNDVDLDIPSELEVAVSRASALAESMVRSPRMRGFSYNSTSPTPPASPNKGGTATTPSPNGKMRRANSPVSPTLLGAPALTVDCVGNCRVVGAAIDTKRTSSLEQQEDKQGKLEQVTVEQQEVLSPVKLTNRSTRRLSDRLLSFDTHMPEAEENEENGAADDEAEEDDENDKTSFQTMKEKSLKLRVPQHQEDDCKHPSPKHADTVAKYGPGRSNAHAPTTHTFQLPLAFQQFNPTGMEGTAFDLMKKSPPHSPSRSSQSESTFRDEDENDNEQQQKKMMRPMSGMFVLPTTSPERRRERRERQRRRSFSDSEKRGRRGEKKDDKMERRQHQEELLAAEEEAVFMAVCSDDERFLRSPRRRRSLTDETAVSTQPMPGISSLLGVFSPPRRSMASSASSTSSYSPCGFPSNNSSLSPATDRHGIVPAATRTPTPADTPESSPLPSPKSGHSGTLFGGNLGGGKPLSRTMSFLDMRTTSSTTSNIEHHDHHLTKLPRRPLRMATFSESKDLTSRPKNNNAATTLDRMFFSYLNKLLLDLCELKKRQKRRAAAEQERIRAESHSPTVSSSGTEEDGDGFYIGGDE
jgi:hypothetical protein